MGKRALRLSPFDPLAYRPLIALAFTHLFLGNPEAAADHAARAVQANPSFDSAHSILVASLVERGHVKEAHEAATRLLAAFPHFRVAKRRHRSGFRDTVQFERYLEALRGAGLPD